MVLKRTSPARLTFAVNPEMLVSALIVFALGEKRPVWAVAHPSLELTEEVGLGTEITMASPPEATASLSTGFVEFGAPHLGSGGSALSEIGIGQAPPGWTTAIPLSPGTIPPGRQLTLILIGSRSGFIRFTA